MPSKATSTLCSARVWRCGLSASRIGLVLLAGSSATFGLTAQGEAAQVLELMVNPLVEPGASLTEETKAKVGLAIQALQRHLPAQGPEDSV